MNERMNKTHFYLFVIIFVIYTTSNVPWDQIIFGKKLEVNYQWENQGKQTNENEITQQNVES